MPVQHPLPFQNRSEMATTEISVAEKPVIFRKLALDIPSTTYATFGLYRYPAKFIPQVVAYALKTYARPGMSVFDPFAGYGTVGTLARLYGNDYELWDLNPLLGEIHPISVMKPFQLNPHLLIDRMKACKKSFAPDWSNIAYWFPEEFLPMLLEAWGFYHSLENENEKRILLIPLLKASRYFSYNDERRQKLSRSTVATKRVETLLAQDWSSFFFKMVLNGIRSIQKKLYEYASLEPKEVQITIKAGEDTFSLHLQREHSILITSPPYLQAQEYIRASKMDLFWLGHSEALIRELGKKEMPYRDVPLCQIHSHTYLKCFEQIHEQDLSRLFEKYFCGVLGALTRLQEKVQNYLLLFVGPATIRTVPIPIDRIFAEHFTALGWRHEVTLIDTIAARSMFFYKANPATGLKDNRMLTEHLVILSRR